MKNICFGFSKVLLASFLVFKELLFRGMHIMKSPFERWFLVKSFFSLLLFHLQVLDYFSLRKCRVCSFPYVRHDRLFKPCQMAFVKRRGSRVCKFVDTTLLFFFVFHNRRSSHALHGNWEPSTRKGGHSLPPGRVLHTHRAGLQGTMPDFKARCRSKSFRAWWLVEWPLSGEAD